jgi:uncharacterized protein (DUF58 family)
VTRPARGSLAVAAGFVTAIGIAFGNTYWVLFGVIALLVLGQVEMWWRWGGVGLEYRRVFAAKTATCGDVIDCTIEVTNRKLLPMPWIDVVDDWPSALVPDRVRLRRKRHVVAGAPEQSAGHDTVRTTIANAAEALDDIAQQTDREAITQRLTLAPFERVRRHYRLPCRRRGAYAFGPVAMRWRDAFGLTSRGADLNLRSAIIVYPRIVPVTAPPAAARQLLGTSFRPRALLTDQTRLAGVRPFISGDSVRRIHWGATARTGVLQVRRDDPTAGRRMWIVVDVETAPEDRWWSAGDTDVHETLAIVAASLAAWALRSGTAVGIFANGRTSGSAVDLWVPCAGHPEQLAQVLDALARLRPWPSRPLRDAITVTGDKWPPDATIALVTAMPSETKSSAVARASRHAQPVVVIDCRPRMAHQSSVHVADQVSRRSTGATWHLADADVSWSTRTEVRLS